VALLARDHGRLAALADRIGPAAVPLSCDITDADAVRTAVGTAAGRLGGLDALVNSAGVFTAGPVADVDPAAWRGMFEVNVLGLLGVTRAAMPHLEAAAKAGAAPSVVNISSMSGRRVPRPDFGVYAATKFAVHALGEAMRLEFAPKRVRVTTVSPGLVDTGIASGWPDREYAQRFRERLRTDGLSAEAVADAVVHVLATPPDVAVVEYAVMSVRQ
jgi:NADP-dependent 3-hydroxy acid dehydrogenase YdfG